MKTSIQAKLREAELLFDKAESLKAMSKFEESGKIFRKIIKTFRLCKDHEKLCASLNELGTVCIHNGNFTEASKILKSALSISERIENRTLYSDIIGNIGIINFYLEKYEESKRLFEIELSINVKRKDKYRIQLALGKIGNVYSKTNDHAKAIKYFERQRNICKAIGKDRFLIYAYGGLANCYLEKRDFERSFEYFKKQIILCEKIHEPRGLSLVLCNTGSAYFIKQDYATALIYFNRALNINLRLKNYRDLIYIYGHLGSAYRQKKNYRRAIHHYKKQFELSNRLKMSRQKAIALGELGNIFKEKDDLKSSSKYYNRQLLISKKNNNKTGLYYALENIGEINRLQRKFGVSMKCFSEQLILGKQVYGSKHFLIARIYRNIGNVCCDLKKYKETLKYYQKSLVLCTSDFKSMSLKNNPSIENTYSESDLFESLKAKAFALRKLSEYGTGELKYLKLSLKVYETALELIDKMRLSFKDENSKYLLIENLIPVYEQAIDTAFSLYNITNHEAYIEKAFGFAEKNKAVTLLENMNESEALILSQLPKNLLEDEKSFRNQISLYESQKYKENQKGRKANKNVIGDLEEKLFDSKRKYNAFVERLEKEYPEYHSLKYKNSAACVNEIRKKILDGNSVLIEYFIGERKIFIFKIGNTAISMVSLEKPGNFENRVKRMRVGIVNDSPLSIYNGYAKFTVNSFSLYSLLIKQILNDTKDINRLIIIPDGLIGYIPFEALISELPVCYPDYKKLQYLIKSFTISYGYSSLLLLKNYSSQFRKQKRRIIGIAPSFENHLKSDPRQESGKIDNFRSQLVPLNYNEDEVRNINKLFSGDYLLGDDATKKIFLERANQYSIIHLATHCIIDNNNPMHSRICFTRSLIPGQEDYLYNYELFNLKLNSRLAVLSACQTGLGKLMKGEGIISIARGFTFSNCDSVVMSLWQVNDQSTSKLMVGFYENLFKGIPIDASLRLAKLSYLDEAMEYNSSPFFWAPFIVIGNSEAI